MENMDLFQARILVVDDEEANVRAVRRILERAGYRNVQGTTSPQSVVGWYREWHPDLILLDLQMPELDGLEVLRQLAPLIPHESFLPILILTGDASAEAKRKALSSGAKDFLTKPFRMDEVLLRIRNLLETRSLHVRLRAQNELLELRVRERTRALEETRFEVLDRLAIAAEFRDDDTGDHTRRVGMISASLARALGLSAEYVDVIRRAAPLHDVGKIGIPDAVLLKPGALTPEEFATMKTHAVIGAEMLSGGQSELIQMAEQIALSHHERWDGTGYPEGLAGAAILLAARIVAVADVFDALTHDRPYRPAWPFEAVFAEMRLIAGRHLDPEVVMAFVDLPMEERSPIVDAPRRSRTRPPRSSWVRRQA